MSRDNLLEGTLKAIFPILFNAVFFILGESDRPVSVWISYAFIHFAYIAILVTPHLVRDGKSATVFGYALYAVSYMYFFIAFAAGGIFILVAPESYRGAFLVQLCLAGVYCALFITNMLANEHTAYAEEMRQPRIDYVKTATMEMATIVGRISDRETRRRVEKAYDAINASQAGSHPDLAELESQILGTIACLRESIPGADLTAIQEQAGDLLQIVNERNRQLRLLRA